jgi:hypothetical protein
MKQGREGRVLKQLSVVSHEDVDVACFDVLVGPDDGVVAHLDGRCGSVGGLVNTCEYMHIWARRMIPGVPLLVLNGEGMRKVFHDWMIR